MNIVPCNSTDTFCKIEHSVIHFNVFLSFVIYKICYGNQKCSFDMSTSISYKCFTYNLLDKLKLKYKGEIVNYKQIVSSLMDTISFRRNDENIVDTAKAWMTHVPMKVFNTTEEYN